MAKCDNDQALQPFFGRLCVGWRLVRIGAGVHQPPAGILVCLDPWSDNVFQCAACRSTSASLPLVDEAACASAAFRIKVPSQSVVSVCIRTVERSELVRLSTILLAYSTYVVVVLFGTQSTADARSDFSCDTCKTALLPFMLGSTSLAIDRISGVVSTEVLDHLSSQSSS